MTSQMTLGSAVLKAGYLRATRRALRVFAERAVRRTWSETETEERQGMVVQSLFGASSQEILRVILGQWETFAKQQNSWEMQKRAFL